MIDTEFLYDTLVYDTETNGLLPKLTRIHCLVIRHYETGEVFIFRQNEHENTIEHGIRMLEHARIIVGQNNNDFDEKAIKKCYPWYNPRGKLRDTLVMMRMCFADQRDKDFRLWERGKLPGQLIGSNTLEAWGYRLGLNKGDYAKEMEAEAKAKGIIEEDEITEYVWGTWNPRMESYCENDVDVNVLMWAKVLRSQWDEHSTVFQHQAHALWGEAQVSGIFFNVAEAEKLAAEIEAEAIKLGQLAIAHYGRWYAPVKKRIVRMLWDDPGGHNRKKKYPEPRTEYGENLSRAVWAEVQIPKKTMKFKDPAKGDRFEGAPHCPIVYKEFKPTSRQMIIDRFTTVYDWKPFDEDFTDKGNPEISDEILRNLVGKIPMAEELAEVFYLYKRLGQIKTGKEAWLNHVDAEGKIHPRFSVGATLSGRVAHSKPNIGQVPRVVATDVKLKDGSINKKVLGPDGKPIPSCFNPDGSFKKKTILKGRGGKHGWDCRNLFYVPEEWGLMVGCDLSGIELRCLAEVARPFDEGVLIDIILNGDIHTINQVAAGLDNRDQAKTLIYALIYGGGDRKLGAIALPLATEEEQRTHGAEMRARLMLNVPSLRYAVEWVKGHAKKGILPGLDGRRLFVRSPHSALNLKLQSDAALIAQKWTLLTEEYLQDMGLEPGWDADYVQMLWIHDEQQIALRNGIDVEVVKKLTIKAAKDAGLYFGYVCPVDAEAKHGHTWAQTH